MSCCFVALTVLLAAVSCSRLPRPTPNATESFWLVDAPFQDTRTTSDLPAFSDVVVIGAGMTGASTSWHLLKQQTANISVTLLDARGVSAGATGRNGGHLHPSQDVSFQTWAHTFGISTAKAALKFEERSNELLLGFIKQENIDAEAVLDGAVDLLLTIDEVAKRRQSLEFYRAQGPPAVDVDWWDRKEVQRRMHTNKFLAGANTPTAGQFWPARVVFKLAELALQLGLNLQTRTEALEVKEGHNEIEVLTSRGTIRCKDVVFATNAYTGGIVPELEVGITPVTNQVVSTLPLPTVLWNYTSSSDEDYYYLHQRPSDRRIILGGARDVVPGKRVGIFDDSTLNAAMSEALSTYVSRIYPQVDPVIDREWAGVLGFTEGELPFVGPLSGQRNRNGRWVAAGYSGQGMTKTFLAGKVISEFILHGRPHDVFVEDFLPSRRLAKKTAVDERYI